MLNMNYKESEHILRVRKDYLEKIENEPRDNFEKISDSLDKVMYFIEEEQDSKEAYLKGYLEGQKDLAILSVIGFAVGCIIVAVINYFIK